MADPTIQTFCCHNRNHSDSAVKLMTEFNKDSFIVVCMLSSIVGVLGSIYQIFFRKEAHSTSIDNFRTRSVRHLGRRIIVWLALADLFASSGIFIRSALWKYVANVFPYEDDTTSVVFCSVCSAWTQFFYTATWLWTLAYALDVKSALLRQRNPDAEMLYHKIIWPLAALLTSIGATVLYYPDANCHDIHNLSTAALRVLPNYLVTYIPIATVMIVNPLLYSYSSKEIDKQLIARLSQITANERLIMNKFKLKFALITTVFYVCWLPNLINGVILWSSWVQLPVKFVVFNWYVMAITNPLQAFFNVLVYRKWDSAFKITELKSPVVSSMLCASCFCILIICFYLSQNIIFLKSNHSIQKRNFKTKKCEEKTPLLTPPTTSSESVEATTSYSTDNTVQQVSAEHSVNSCSFV